MFAQLPAWLVQTEPKRQAHPVGDTIPKGGRNAALASIAGSMRRRGSSAAAILAALRVENDERCDPPLPDDEVEAIAKSVGRYEPAPPATTAETPEPEEAGHSAADSPPEPAATPSRFRLISAAEMEDMPPPKSLVGDKIHQGSLAALVGPPGHGKTFVALGWSASVAMGVPACGDAVHTGPSIYVAAEGSAGLGVRTRAWRAANHISGPLGVHFITEPVSLLNASDVGHFLRALDTLPEPPALVVLDTLAWCMVGGDENSTQDMSAFIAGADKIRTQTGAAVLILHHMNAGGERERGNTALRGACDTLMFVEAEADLLTLTCEKQKDAPPFPKALLRLLQIAESCAVVTANSDLQSASEELTEKQLETLALLQTHFLTNGATATEWLKASGITERTFYNYRTLLVRKGYVHEPEQARGGRYTLSEAGRDLVTASCNNTATILHFSGPKSLHASRGGVDTPLHGSNGAVDLARPAGGYIRL